MKRISMVASVLCLFFVSVAWGQQPAGKCSNNWSEFHRTNMQRWNPCEKVLSVNNVGKLVLKWKYTTGSVFHSSPAVVNGVVYVGSVDANVYALNASTGAKLWSYTTGAEVDSSPAVVNGVVYVGSLDNNVYALNASTGAKLWSYATLVQSSPAVANGVVYVSSLDNNVYALQASTGAVLWSYATGDRVFSSPAVVDGVVYVGSYDNNVYALNASTGAKLWSYATGTGRVLRRLWRTGWFMSAQTLDNIYALNASTGAKLWSYTLATMWSPRPRWRMGWFMSVPTRHRVRAERQDRRHSGATLPPAVWIPRQPWEWSGLCRVQRPQPICAGCPHRRQALEPQNWRLGAILAVGDEWGGLRRRECPQSVRLRPEVKEGRAQSRAAKGSALKNASPQPQPKIVRPGHNTVRLAVCGHVDNCRQQAWLLKNPLF